MISINLIGALMAGACAVISIDACAQHAQGVDVLPGATGSQPGTSVPPLPAAGAVRIAKPCPAASPCHAGPWHMVATPNGLQECTEPYARPGTCRASTYGAQKLARLWVIKQDTRWLWCQHPDTRSRCVDMFARPPANLPYPAVQ